MGHVATVTPAARGEVPGPSPEPTTSTVPTTGGRPGAPRRRERAGRRARTVLWALPVPVLVLLLWHAGVTAGWDVPGGIRMAELPTPAAVLVRLVDLTVGGLIDDSFSAQLWRHVWASLVRAVSGFLLAAALAIPLGVLMGRSARLTRMLEPTLNLVRPVPVTAWAPLALIMIGIGDNQAVFLVFLAAFFPVLVNTVTAVQQVPPRLLEAAAMLGTSRWRRLWTVVVPAAAPGIVSGLRVSLGLAWALLVVGEMTGINLGLGAMITEAKVIAQTDLIVAGMVVIGLLGFATDRLLVLLVRVATGGRPLLQEDR
ncbi:ABC transporter permease [Isoptericola sp. S6320L]|uniref:ABC transporter permease n=1 Tax=Isoptericola sp. S6320L TaxID=2926411 RepID=UPI001FF52F45|nr:ABC transporter permease [Isoptericola sp. S6320L]MCK0115965.1 ABC transporter permease [Isoptericola sp. S6320L]